MTAYLFSIGVGVEDRPQRWLGICPIYANLARGLVRLGHDVSFVVNPAAFDAAALAEFPVTVGGHDALIDLSAKNRFEFGFIWGGRVDADYTTRQIFTDLGITPVFSELGWLPQKGTLYFDLQGTNSQITIAAPLRALSTFERLSFAGKRIRVARRRYDCLPRLRQPKLGSSPLKVFVPLQDETDTNITEDSPFLKMNELVGFLSRTYPKDRFVIRPHPRAERPLLDGFDNVELQDASADPIKCLGDFDLIIGINSTMLTEAAFLRHRVACFGQGIASLYGLAAVIDPMAPPAQLQDIPDPGPRADEFHYLLTVKQLSQSKLADPNYLLSTYLAEMLNLDRGA